MHLQIGIVGLPNVGKSTLFNALLKKQQALAANYPFATIEPNVGIVPVPDERLQVLAKITAREIAGFHATSGESTSATPEESLHLPAIKPATVEFVDIAGLVKGASEGAGLGNKFLSHIREVSVIAHVVRAFEDPNIIKEGSVDPLSDYKTIQTELMLADAQTLAKVLENRKNVDIHQKSAAEKLLKGINEDIPVRLNTTLTDEERESISLLGLLSHKPEIIVLNVSEEQYNPEGIKKVTQEYSVILNAPPAGGEGSRHPENRDSSHDAQNDKGSATNLVVICAKIESDLSELTPDEQKQYLADLGLQTSGLERLIQKAYQQLGLISFLTVPSEKPSSAKASEGQWEVRAWTIKKGTDAQYASGEIHTDFIKHFIKAEVVSYADFVANNGWKRARESGRARQEGKTYVVEDGDVVEFKIGK